MARTFFIICFLNLILKPCLAQWNVLSFNTGANNYSVNFLNADTGFIGGGVFTTPPNLVANTYLYRTNNGGISWFPVFNNDNNTPTQQIHFFSNTTGLSKRWQDRIRKTTDGGLTWTDILQGSTGSPFRFQAIDSLSYLFAYGNIKYFSNDGGLTWRSDTLRIPTHVNSSTFLEFETPAKGFVWGHVYNSSTGIWGSEVYSTTDSGRILTPSLKGYSSSSNYKQISRIKITDHGAAAIILAGNYIIRSTDFGSTWDTVYVAPTGITFTALDASNDVVVATGNSGYIVTSIDNGVNFINENSGISENIQDVCIAPDNAGVAYAVAYNGRIIKRNNLTSTKNNIITNSTTVYPNPLINSNQIFVKVVEEGIFKINIFDQQGSNIITENKISINRTLEIDIKNLPKGLYYISWCGMNTKGQSKFIKD